MTDSATKDTLDPGHLWTPLEWEQVVQEAEGLVRRAAMRLGASAFPSVDGFIPARWGGGSQKPTFGVLHDAETPLANGYALSISNMFRTTSTEKSAHFMVGPDAAYQLRDTNLLAWHCGNGNRFSIGVEQTGYAAFTPDQWLTAAGVSQLNRVAALIRDINRVHGIGMYWMTDQQLRDAYNGRFVGGWATHHQCSRVLGGSSHTDPDPNYPFAKLMTTANGKEIDDMLTDEQDTRLKNIEIALGAVNAAGTEKVKRLADDRTVLAVGWDIQDKLAKALPVLLADANEPDDPEVFAAAVVAAIPLNIAERVVDLLGEKISAAS